jgi:hypothetical protein
MTAPTNVSAFGGRTLAELFVLNAVEGRYCAADRSRKHAS